MLQCLKKTNKQTKTMGGGHQRKKISILQIVFLLINITLVTSTQKKRSKQKGKHVIEIFETK